MVEQREPNIKDQSQTKEMSERMKDFVHDLRTNIQQFDIDGTETWREKMMTARNQRQGIKRHTNTPYPGAPDIPLPETDKLIRKKKPEFVLSATSGKKLVNVKAKNASDATTPELKEKVRKADIAMNHLFKKEIPWIRRLTLAADRFLEKGFCVFKVIEKFKSREVNRVIDVDEFEATQPGIIEEFRSLDKQEQLELLAERFGMDIEVDKDKDALEGVIDKFNAGEKRIEFVSEEVSSFPDVLVPLPEKVYVPKGTTDIRFALRITHEFFLSEKDLVGAALKGVFLKDKVMKLIGEGQGLKTGDRDINEKLKDRINGISDDEEAGEMFRIHETIAWFQPADNKPFERWVFTFMADGGSDEESLIQYRPYPFEFEELTYVRHDNEIVDENHYRSRGLPEQIRAMQEIMERSINATLVRDEINNAPMYTVLSTSPLLKGNIRFVPGQKLRVQTHDDIKPLMESRSVDVSGERIVQNMKAFTEEYIGSNDQLFRNATNKGGGKTLGEVELGVQSNQFQGSLDTMNWLDSLSQVYQIVFNILRERLVTPLVVNGETITREDFQFDADVSANGSIELADKQFQVQKALARLQLVRQARADGVATSEDVFNAYKDFGEKDGIVNTDTFFTDPKEILQQQITQMEQQAQQLNQLIEQQNQVIAEGEDSLEKTEDNLREKAKNEQS